MIRLQDIRQKFTDIREQVEQRVYDPFVLQYIDTPIIDEDKLLILISIMDCLELSYSEMKTYCLSTMLIQIALDTHEQISTTAVEEKSRQLTVLAGDYFSGMYYKLLADLEDISMIKALSEGVKEINENKITVYQKGIDGIEKLMNSIKRIESSLLLKFTGYFQLKSWDEFIANLFFIKRLLAEKRKFKESGRSLVIEGLKNIIFHIDDHETSGLNHKQQQELLEICDHYIELAKQTVEKGMLQLPFLTETLVERIQFLLNQHQTVEKTFVEEG